MREEHSLTEAVKQLYQKMSATYIPDTYSKVSMYFPLMAAMELSVGKSLPETLINRTLVTGTDLMNGIAVGVTCDYTRKKFNAENEGLKQKLIDTGTSIAILEALYAGYQYVACQITNRSTDTIVPACINLSIILLITGGTYGQRRNNCRKDYSIKGNTSKKFKNMLTNDYYRIKNWTITDLNYSLSAL